jgi:serine/threonine protein phosphatase 1
MKRRVTTGHSVGVLFVGASRRKGGGVDLHELVTLGDYVDRGQNSRGVLDFLIELTDRCRLIPLLGNHEEMMWAACQGHCDLRLWLECGGRATLDSYGQQAGPELVPRCHLEFIERCHSWFETETHFFVHANYHAHLPLEGQEVETLRWLSLRNYMPPRHVSGKTAIVGHIPQPDGEILDVGYLRCLANSNGRTQRVGELPANPFGLHDLYGNVLEWCWDWHGKYAAGAVSDPMGSAAGSARVVRGGAYNGGLASYCRSAIRGVDVPVSLSRYGFRVCCGR